MIVLTQLQRLQRNLPLQAGQHTDGDVELARPHAARRVFPPASGAEAKISRDADMWSKLGAKAAAVQHKYTENTGGPTIAPCACPALNEHPRDV